MFKGIKSGGIDMSKTSVEIMRRIEVSKKRKELKTYKALSGGILLLAIMLITVVSQLTIPQTIDLEQVTLGAYLLNPSVGGYVLVAVLAFTAGVLLAVVVQKMKNIKDPTSAENQKSLEK